MKKTLLALATLLILATGITSCNTQEDSTHYYFALGLQEYSVSGSETDKSVEQYLSKVFDTYCEALGMSSTNPVLIFSSGAFSERAADLKAKFDNTTLPEPPTTSLSYSFTVALTGVGSAAHGGAGGSETIATQTFTNR